jgi:hypothetical protein
LLKTILRALAIMSGAPAEATDIARISPLAHAHAIPSGTSLRARDERRRGRAAVVACKRGAGGAFLQRSALAVIVAPYPDIQL